MALSALLLPIIKSLLLPPGCFIALAVLGAAFWRRRPRLGKALCGLSLALLYLLSTGAGSWLLVHPLEALEPPLGEGPSAAGAIVVLTAGRVRNSPEFGKVSRPDFTALTRITYAAHLYRKRHLPLLVTGGLITDDPGEEPLAIGMQRVFVDEFQIPVRWVEPASCNTAQNARFSAAMLKEAGLKHVILVTDAVHMRRAVRAFEHQGLTVTPAPTFYMETSHFSPLRLMPTIENLRRSHAALYEWLGLGWYALTDSAA